MPSRQNPRKYPLGRCRGMMAQERNLPVALRGDPIELDDPARPDEGLVTVPRVFSPFERKQRALHGRHLNEDIIQVIAGAQEAQTSTLLLPTGIDVDQHGDDLAQRVRVDLAVACAAPPAYGGRGRASG